MHLSPINYDALYAQRMAAEATAKENGGAAQA
jgi:preprotein translocase subunit SecB